MDVKLEWRGREKEKQRKSEIVRKRNRETIKLDNNKQTYRPEIRSENK